MESEVAKQNYGHQSIADMDIEKVFQALRTWNAWLLRGKIEMGAAKEIKENALKVARFLGTKKQFVDALIAFKPAGKISRLG